MNTLPLLLGGAGLILLSGSKKTGIQAKHAHADDNQSRLIKLEKATAVRLVRDKQPPFYSQTSELTIDDLNNDIELRDELKRYQNVNASQEEIDTFLHNYIAKKAEEYRRSKSYWPQWPDWMTIAVVGGTTAILLGPELLAAWGLAGTPSLLDLAFAAWQISDLVGYAAQGSQVFSASLLADAWVGSRLKPTTKFLKMMGINILEGGIVHEVIIDI